MVLTRFYKFIAFLAFTTFAFLYSQITFAQVEVPLSGVNTVDNRLPIYVADFMGPRGKQIADIVAKDLTNSGQFNVTRIASISKDPHDKLDWDKLVDLSKGANIVTGFDNKDHVHYRFLDPIQQKVREEARVSNPSQRAIAHKISDYAYEQSIGLKGAFSTKIAFVSGRSLYISDYDGHNAKVLVSGATIISPAWSPDGSKIAYVSFESGKPIVYVQQLSTGVRIPVASFKGNNSAPAWSPSGVSLAVALSRDALSDIYIVSSDGTTKSPRSLSSSPEIETEPFFFPNNSGLVFVSDRGGSPQIYKSGLNNGPASRITFNGSQNLSPRISPDSNSLVFTSLRKGKYVIALMNLASGDERVISSGPDDLSPTFSPNGMNVMHVSSGKIKISSTVSNFSITIPTQGAVSAVTWGPFIK
ncbi:PD40 domain-containing protein [Taylorella equigenitalis]|uniref:PD40 domain-containing protein n=1 Tax=Taylorella equigenitalis TaxID=29575 RepID=UPI00051E0864|nr:PD40 domain-containing protein [Taylorella equigenitalis]KGK33408.1 translocation protein TolB [Taylorella equigenitalis]